MIPGISSRRRFSDLSEQEIIALAISSEEDDARIYRSYAERLRSDFSESARMFDGMAEEEDEHRHRLIELHKKRFGDTIPLIRREHVAGFYARNPVWLIENLGLERIREEAANMEQAAHNFYLKAAARTHDADTRKLLGDLASAEAGHVAAADRLEEKYITDDVREHEDRQARRAVHSDLGAAGTGWTHGWLRFDTGTDLRDSIRHAGYLDDIPCRTGRLRRSRNLDGLHRGGVR